MFRSFFWSRKWALRAYGGLAFLLLCVYAQVSMAVYMNGWFKSFQAIWEKAHEIPIDQGVPMVVFNLGQFLFILLGFLAFSPFNEFLASHYNLWWREAITFNYIPRWQNVTRDITASSQRIQEDTKLLGRLLETLGLGVVRSFMTLGAFIPILWALSTQVGVIDPVQLVRLVRGNYEGGPIFWYISGALVWMVLITTTGATFGSLFVGKELPRLEYNNQNVEARWRNILVYAEKDKSLISVEVAAKLFADLKHNYKRLFLHNWYFGAWLHAYDQCLWIFPYVVIGFNLFGNDFFTFSLMVQIVHAFESVHRSFSFFVQNWRSVTELRSVHMRLREFEDNLKENEKIIPIPAHLPVLVVQPRKHAAQTKVVPMRPRRLYRTNVLYP